MLYSTKLFSSVISASLMESLQNSCKLQICLNLPSFLFPPFLYVHFLDTFIKPYKFNRLLFYLTVIV